MDNRKTAAEKKDEAIWFYKISRLKTRKLKFDPQLTAAGCCFNVGQPENGG